MENTHLDVHPTSSDYLVILICMISIDILHDIHGSNLMGFHHTTGQPITVAMASMARSRPCHPCRGAPRAASRSAVTSGARRARRQRRARCQALHLPRRLPLLQFLTHPWQSIHDHQNDSTCFDFLRFNSRLSDDYPWDCYHHKPWFTSQNRSETNGLPWLANVDASHPNFQVKAQASRDAPGPQELPGGAGGCGWVMGHNFDIIWYYMQIFPSSNSVTVISVIKNRFLGFWQVLLLAVKNTIWLFNTAMENHHF